MSKNSKQVDLREMPLCIIAAKPEELGVIASHLNLNRPVPRESLKTIPGVNPNQTFYQGSFQASTGVRLPYYLTCCSRQGLQTFGVEATSLFLSLKPMYAVHVGACAGIDGKTE